MSDRQFRGWAAYRESVVDVVLDGAVVTLGAEGVIAGERWSPARPVYVVTAYNPGRARGSAANEAAQIRLLELLAERGIAWLPSTGRSRDGSWQEPSAALLETSEAEAIEIAREFEQDAIFSWDGLALRVLDCATRDD